MTDPTRSLAQQLSGSYRLERPLGEGGMATVYLAQDLKHQRPVALKVLKPELAFSLGPERFRREITTAARLQHPHILSVFDSGETADGQLWFTMPFVNGETLRARLAREHRLPVDEALRITREAALALHHAHVHGIVHRDVKPENLLLTEDGSTLVADFGIARGLGAGGGRLTETGTSIGTPMYMAPEQATGDQAIDARADQYSLAVTLYEMLAGEPPFTGETAGAIVAKRFTSATPSVREKRPEVPPLVDQALQRGLSLQAEERFATIQEFARAAGAVMATPSSPRTAAIPTPSTAGTRRRSPLVLGAGALAIGAMLAAVVLARRATSSPPSTGPAAAAVDSARTLAVLPFENLGDTADAYFAEGIADELRGKLTGVPGLEVIARASSVQYKGSTRNQADIARELGVRYLLTGTVRWEKAGGGKGRVRVSPELIEVGANGRPTSRWQQPFDLPITDVFQMQSDMVQKVATALDVTLGAGAQQQLARQPTTNLAAYQAYLQGEAIGGGSNFFVDLQRAFPLYERAVTLDSSFGLAWAHLAIARSTYYAVGKPSAELRAKAEAAARRSVALGPRDAEAHRAMGSLYQLVLGDLERARAEFDTALTLAPGNADVLSSLGAMEQNAGDWEGSLVHLRQAVVLDPRSPATARRLARSLLWLRRPAEGVPAAERAQALAPTSLDVMQMRAMFHLGQGDLAGAHQVLREAAASVPAEELLPYFSAYFDLYWLLDDGQQRALLALPLSAFEDSRQDWALIQAQVRHLRGDTVGARAFADTARAEFGKALRDTPDDVQLQVQHALALAYLGHDAEAQALTERALGRKSSTFPAYLHLLFARMLVLGGAHDRAIAELERILAEPMYVTRAWLRLDPSFAPLREEPAFQRLVAGS